jgi:hypothetical protein
MYYKLSMVLVQKQGENLEEIDLEELRIEKKRLLLMELKKMKGDGNLKSRQASPGEDRRKGVDPGGYREGRSQT